MPKPTPDCRATERKHPWPMARLGDVCGTINGIWKGLRKPFVHVGIIRSSNMTKNCEFSLDKTIYIDVEEKKYKQRKLLAGDIIVERSGGGPGQPVGRAVYFDLEDGEYSVSNFTSILRVKDANALNGKFLQLYLTSQYFQGATENIQSNTTGLHNLDFDAYLNFDVPLPPLSEQKEIVARLERELAAVEKMKKGFEALSETAKAEFKAELKEVFEELDGKMDGQARSSEQGHLSWRELGEVCDVRDGTHDTPAKCDNGYLLLTSKNVRKGKVDKTNAYCISASDYAAINKRSGVDQWDVLFSMIGTVGETAIVDEPPDFAIKNMGLFKTHADELLARWIKYYFDSPVAKQLILDRLKGSNQKFLSLGVLRAFPLALTDRDSMLRLVTRIDAAKVRAEKLEAKAREGVAVCETMRKAILKEAFE